MKKSIYLSISALLAAASLCSCVDESSDFGNKAYVDGATSVTSLLLDGSVETMTQTIQTLLPKPAAEMTKVTYAVDPDGVDAYNAIYGQDAVLLPEDFYVIADPVATINAGAVKSSEVEIVFQNLTDIDTQNTYCLPVKIANAGVDVLKSQNTKYFIVRGASLINFVANTEYNYLEPTNRYSAPQLDGLGDMTVEVLVYPNADFGEGNEAGISTWIGVEGYFLLRFGDSGVPTHQLQLATSSGNITDAQWTIEDQKWQFLTFTRTASGECRFYVDAVQKGEAKTSSFRNVVNWNTNDNNGGLYVGRSWSNNRPFNGCMSELRVWNRVLTRDELLERNHFYRVDADADGLVAYWKFDEGGGTLITDYAYGFNLQANSDLLWVPVSLPN